MKIEKVPFGLDVPKPPKVEVYKLNDNIRLYCLCIYIIVLVEVIIGAITYCLG